MGANKKGFTLLEVLIAIAILAIVMGAIARAGGVAIDSANSNKARTMGMWVAQNRIAELQAFAKWPAVTIHEGEEEQAKIKFYWRETITATANEKFRRVVVEVFESSEKSHHIARLVGYAHRENPDENHEQ